MWHEWPNGILYLISLSSPFMHFTFCAAPSFRFKLKSWAGTGCCLSVALFSHCLVTGLHNPFFSPHYMFHLPTYSLISKQVLHSTELCLQHSVSSELCILNCDSFWQKTPLTGQQRECKRQERFLRNCKSIPHFWGSKGNCPPSSLKGGSRGWGLCVKIRWNENAGDNDVLGKFQGLTLPLIPDPPPSMFSQLLNRITRVHSASH